MMVRGVLFDKDGTLFKFADTWSIWAERVFTELASDDRALRFQLAKASGYDLKRGVFEPDAMMLITPVDEVNRLWLSMLPHLTEEAIVEISIRNLKSLPLYPTTALAAYFQALRSRGLKIGVATNDYEQSANLQLTEAGVGDTLDFVCGYDSGFGRKPDPGMIYGFCAHVGLPASEIAMVGDTVPDLEAGRAAGVKLVVGVLTGPANERELSRHADLVLPSIAQLPAHLD